MKMSTKPYRFLADERFIISMMPADLRNEVAETLAFNPAQEEALWWNQRSDEDFEQLAYAMMNDDTLWGVWRETLNGAMREEMRHIKIREAEISTEHNGL